MKVRYATEQDLDFIWQCNLAMADETEDVGLDSAQLRHGIAYLQAHPKEGLYLVAEKDGRLVGTLGVTFEWSDWRNGRFWWIQSVYIMPSARRTGIYTQLHEYVRKISCDDSQACGIRLYVEQENSGAQLTYENVGMNQTHYRLYEELIR